MADEDFDEEEVWSVLGHKEKRENGNSRNKKSSSNDALIPKRLEHSASRMIPPRSIGTANNNNQVRIFQPSDPLNIPDWSKIYRKGIETSLDLDGADDHHDHVDRYKENIAAEDFDDDRDNDDDDDDRVPPHELIARKLARSHITSSSVYEGAGRTLKGRDLSEVRHAVLTSTGFLQ